MPLEGRGHIFKGVTQMKLVSTFLVAVFVVAVSTSFALADCAGHNKAQLVKNPAPAQEQVSKDQPARPSAPLTVAEKTGESAQPIVNAQGKK
jgi:hypothetical protein